MMTSEQIAKLNTMLMNAGALPNSYSINHPRNYRLNLAQENDGQYMVWFQDDGGRYEVKTFDDLGQAVYNFATRLVATSQADEIARAFGDEKIKTYH